MKIANSILIILSLSFLLPACKKDENILDASKKSSETHVSAPSITGDWQTPGMQIIAFHNDGTMTITDAGKEFPGRYTLQDGNKIQIDTGHGTSIQTYSFKDSDTLMMSKGTSAGSMEEFRRITHK